MAITRSRGCWWCDERTPPVGEGRRVRGWFATLHDVARALEEAAAPIPVPESMGPTLKEFIVDFLKHEPARKDPRTYGSNTKILLEHFGDTIRLGEITVPMILDFRIKRIDQDKVKDYSTNRQVACLSAVGGGVVLPLKEF